MDSEEEDEDWSDISELQEIDPNRLQGFKDQNGNVEKKSFGKGKSSFCSQDVKLVHNQDILPFHEK